MRDVLMVAIMIAAIMVFVAYVALCDRIIGSAEPGADDGSGVLPSRARAGGVMVAISFDNAVGLVLAIVAIAYLIVVLDPSGALLMSWQ